MRGKVPNVVALCGLDINPGDLAAAAHFNGSKAVKSDVCLPSVLRSAITRKLAGALLQPGTVRDLLSVGERSQHLLRTTAGCRYSPVDS